MRILLFPLSGYINRIQAVASTALLSEDVKSSFQVCWVTDEVSGASADRVFDPNFFDTHVISEPEARAQFGVSSDEVALHLVSNLPEGTLSLAGSHLGEQHFMPQLRAELEAQEFSRLIIRAGGKFVLQGDSELSGLQEEAFRQRRAKFYSQSFLHPDIEVPARVAVNEHAPFLGLHLRYSDRSHQSPGRVEIRSALLALRESTSIDSLFIASDTAEERERWLTTSKELGFSPWTVDPGSLSRGDATAVTGALVDWRILCGSQGMVYFAESSFAEEAAVASGHFESSIGLRASGARASRVKAGRYLNALVTYPRRHGWLGK